MAKRSLEQELTEFLELWPLEEFSEFVRHIRDIMDLYDVSDDNDWVARLLPAEDIRNVVLMRTAYLMSSIAERFSGKFAKTKIQHPRLHERLQKIRDEFRAEELKNGHV